LTAFKLTSKQLEAQKILSGTATHNLLAGGSRSGKTFLLVRNIVFRALKAPNSRQAIFRFRFNAIKASIVLDTFPKVMQIAYPGVKYTLNSTDYYATFENGAQLWFGGLDDKERTEKILGMEFVTIYFNEASQIPVASIDMAITRLAQKVNQVIDGKETELQPRCYYDLNPPSKGHWSYKRFVLKRDPSTRKPLANPDDYVYFRINPEDNLENLTATYLKTLEALPAHLKQRFLKGEFADENPNALFTFENIETHRVVDRRIPQLLRIIVGIDPSGAGEDDDNTHDDIGIMVGGLGIDGRAYLLEDCTVNAPPAVWGKIATDAYDRYQANGIVAENNFGGAMVKHVIQVARPRTPYKEVRSSRGKQIRAEPFSALYAQGKICHVGYFPELEDELCAFSNVGYTGQGSPNRADAWIFILTEFFSGIVNPRKDDTPIMPAWSPSVPGMGY
jgi:phage terminase large subunit-like protein